MTDRWRDSSDNGARDGRALASVASSWSPLRPLRGHLPHRFARGRILVALIATLLTLAAAPAFAERTPADRQTLLDLAYVLGEAHALRQACDRNDQTWRSRMKRMIDVEAPDQAFEARLTERFNAGFLARQAQFPECGPKVGPAEAEVAKHGAQLSGSLSRSR